MASIDVAMAHWASIRYIEITERYNQAGKDFTVYAALEEWAYDTSRTTDDGGAETLLDTRLEAIRRICEERYELAERNSWYDQMRDITILMKGLSPQELNALANEHKTMFYTAVNIYDQYATLSAAYCTLPEGQSLEQSISTLYQVVNVRASADRTYFLPLR